MNILIILLLKLCHSVTRSIFFSVAAMYGTHAGHDHVHSSKHNIAVRECEPPVSLNAPVTPADVAVVFVWQRLVNSIVVFTVVAAR
ncbi:MAG: hypothetical protein HY308_06360 [Gammaproteobacteria bacterium]|nr:hypothetical protein [Gammaproteobacteria bacterium]